MKRIQQFGQEYSWIEISALVDQRLTQLTVQGADIGIRTGDGAWGESEYRILMDETLFPVCSPTYARRLGDITDNTCLHRAKLLHDRDSQTSWVIWRKEFALDWFDPSPGPRFTSTDMVLSAASKGLGVALARGRMAETELSEGSLIRLSSPLEVRVPGAYWIRVQPDSAKRLATRTFVTWLREECAKPGDWSRE